MEFNLSPIGVVKNGIQGRHKGDHWKAVISDIVIHADLEDALDAIEGFSHIIVLCWLHEISDSERAVMKVHPKGNEELPLVGVLASRSPARPNPISVTTVKLLRRDRNVLKVQGLDAVDGTPVLDIKPHIPHYDSPPQATTPDWVAKD
ncbi:MAG: tRNA (N6-threonylcarbamoyladenosine(37)-N6)-methyltransferase TrmO [Chloroflexi bacterium]|nr:tRNA (N6-threonylcarbamoyladenosine(37)-N6)-methyltransferase TrmO [Chloroflexota bacterium]MBM4452112.1 tRNA (N6-threonylcarbamoyladenosine(37)-N6)-methyltransferase TrmO [Chloroflexota bacterium]MBM4453896.1 tRNA (N6-threonylcarbamoyladenosine(37)-N6)-methyltransferase TrmO [Chloroflexota bacterium]